MIRSVDDLSAMIMSDKVVYSVIDACSVVRFRKSLFEFILV